MELRTYDLPFLFNSSGSQSGDVPETTKTDIYLIGLNFKYLYQM